MVAWRNANGDPYVTQSRSILETRVSLSLSCATDALVLDNVIEDFEQQHQPFSGLCVVTDKCIFGVPTKLIQWFGKDYI